MANQRWRLIPLLTASGKVQMALDRWILQQHRQGNHPPCIRFYTWSPVAISLGYHQRRWPQFWQDLTWHGQPIDIVRRPTGGRAVLHQGDLTYMIVTSNLRGTTLDIYRHICQFLILGCHYCGIELDYGQVGKGYFAQVNCFSTATGADLVDSQGQKFIGSAMLKQGHAILQHGSLILSRDEQLYHQVFGESTLPTRKLLVKGVAQDPAVLIPLLIESMVSAASSYFDIDLIPQPLTESEWVEVNAISDYQAW